MRKRKPFLLEGRVNDLLRSQYDFHSSEQLLMFLVHFISVSLAVFTSYCLSLFVFNVGDEYSERMVKFGRKDKV